MSTSSTSPDYMHFSNLNKQSGHGCAPSSRHNTHQPEYCIVLKLPARVAACLIVIKQTELQSILQLVNVVQPSAWQTAQDCFANRQPTRVVVCLIVPKQVESRGMQFLANVEQQLVAPLHLHTAVNL